MFNHSAIQKYWKDYFTEEIDKEIESKFHEYFQEEFEIAKRENFKSEKQTFLGKVCSCTEKRIVREFERKAFDSCPDYQNMGVAFFDRFMLIALSNLLDMHFEEILSDTFCDLSNEKQEELFKKGVLNSEGDLR